MFLVDTHFSLLKYGKEHCLIEYLCTILQFMVISYLDLICFWSFDLWSKIRILVDIEMKVVCVGRGWVWGSGPYNSHKKCHFLHLSVALVKVKQLIYILQIFQKSTDKWIQKLLYLLDTSFGKLKCYICGRSVLARNKMVHVLHITCLVLFTCAIVWK